MGKGTGDEVVGECAMAEGFCCVGEVVGGMGDVVETFYTSLPAQF